MKLWKYLFLFFFLLLIQVVIANEIKVIYFFHPLSPYSKEVEEEKNLVKEYWESKIEWVEYDFTNETHFKKFLEYDVYSLPVAVVECFEEKIRIDRSEAFTDILNKTIYYCYSKTEEKDLKGFIFLSSILLACILILTSFKRQLRKKLKILKRRIKKLKKKFKATFLRLRLC